MEIKINSGAIDWYNSASGGSSLGTGTTYTTGTLSSGAVYYASASNSNGCVSERVEVTITVNLNPAVAQNSSSVTSLLCNGDMNGSAQVDVTLNGTATSATYLWDDTSASTTEDLAGTGAGTYTMTVTDNNNCTASITFTVTEPPAISASATGSTVDCNGDSDGTINLTAIGGTGVLSFLWDDAGSTTTEDLSGLSAGTYTVTITDMNNCTTISSATVAEPTALTGSGTSTDEINGNDGSIDLTVTGGTSPYTYSWSGPGTFSSTSEDPSGLAEGIYNVIVTDANGCTMTTSVVVSSQVGIDELQNAGLKIYSNPTNGMLTIETTQTGFNKIEMTDATGRLILEMEITGSKTVIDLTRFGKGIYFIHVTNGGIRTIEKVIVQ